MKKLSILAIVTYFVFSTSAGAVPVYFTDRAAFDAATGGGLNFEGFEGAWTDSGGVAVFTDFSVSETGGTNNLFHGFEAGGNSFSTTEGNDSLWYDDNGSSIGSFFNFTASVTAFGLDLSILNFGGAGGSATVNIGGSNISDSIFLNDQVPAFWGVIDLDGINSVTFDRSGANGMGFDAVSYGNVAVVPVPATIALFGLGLALMRLSRRS